MARPPLLIGTWGKIKRHQVEPGHWYANCRVRDHDGVTSRRAATPPPACTTRLALRPSES